LDIPFNAAYRYNYLRASNPVQPVNGSITKDFYYFITDVRYIAPNTTEVVVQLDVWQTFGYEIKFGNSYIERGHIGIANKNAFDNYGRDYLTIPEGLDVGGEYRVIAKRKETVMSILGPAKSSVLVASTVKLLDSTGLPIEAGTASAPVLQSADGSTFQGLPSGASYYIFESTTSFTNYMKSMTSKPWITQGIISITVVPESSRYAIDPTVYSANGYPTPVSNFAPLGLTHSMFENWRASGEILNSIPSKYRHLTKFLTYPYTVIEMTTWGGTPVILKPESWSNSDAKIIERASLVPPNQRVIFAPQSYNSDGENVDQKIVGTTMANGWNVGDDNGEYLDITTQIAQFPSMAIVNNGAISYMASNNSGISFQNHSADWSQQRALRGNEVSYDQASGAITTANKQTGIGINADASQTGVGNQTAMYQGIASGATSLVGGAVGGPASLGSAALGVAGMAAGIAIQTNANNQSLAIRNNTAGATNRNAMGQAGMVRDTNKDLADWSANGDYENTIAGINAKVQDARLTQPTTSGQVGGEALNLINDVVELALRFKMIDRASIRAIGDYWLRYGYAVRMFAVIPDTLNVMSKFTYWKLKETYIVSAPMPETFKQAIRGIFEKGVTVWVQPEYIGRTDIGDNNPMGGFTL
jgi:hypothetical protein